MSAIMEPLAWGPRDYITLPEIPAHWRVLDVGPGAYPLKRANLCVDWSADILKPISESGQAILQDDINTGLRSIGDKEFDYVWASHIFEHLEDPAACAATLSRVAKAGTIVVPSAVKESLFLFEEKTHLWMVLPNPKTGEPPIFIRHNRSFVAPLEDTSVTQAMAFLFRTGSNHDCTVERQCRWWYQHHEKDLDIAYHWKDNLELVVIG